MIQPNSDCEAFCYWMLNISAQRLSGPQRVIVQAVSAAAAGAFPITNQEWYNFNLFTAWRYPYYKVYADLATVVNPDLYAGLVNAWDFEGNSTDLVGTRNGTDTSINYGLPYGKILQGAEFFTTSSFIDIGAVFTGAVWSISCWVFISPNAQPINCILSDAGVNYGLTWLPGTQKFSYYDGAQYDSLAHNAQSVWTHLVFTSDGANIKFYINSVLSTTTAAALTSRALSRFSNGNVNFALPGYMDAPAIWNRALIQDEINQLYNAGAGIQYPW